MRRLAVAVVLLFILGVPLSAQPDGRRDSGRAKDRIVQLVKSAFKLLTLGDGLIPPLPTPKP